MRNILRESFAILSFSVQFGIPTISVAGFAGMLAATISSIIESVGDYFAAARLSNAEAPPPHAVNRGIATEGFASIISGMVGAGHPTTSYSGNIGAIGITKVSMNQESLGHLSSLVNPLMHVFVDRHPERIPIA